MYNIVIYVKVTIERWNVTLSHLQNNTNIDFYENENSEFKVNTIKNKKDFLFILSIVFFTLGFLLSCFKGFINFKKNSYINTSYAMGTATGAILVSIIIIVILFLFSIRVFKKKGILLIFSIIYLIGSFSSTTVALETYLNETTMMSKAADDKLIILFNNIANGKDISAENFDKSVYGNKTPLLYLIKDYSIKSHQLSTDMSKDIDSLDSNNILDVNNLVSTEKINDTKEKIDNSIKIYDKYEAEYNNLITNFKTSFLALELPKSFKDGFIQSFNKSQDKNNNKINNFFKVERDSYTKLNNIMDFLLSIQGAYTVKDNKIIFETTDNMNKYNGYIEDIKKLANEEYDITNSINDSLKLKLDELNKSK